MDKQDKILEMLEKLTMEVNQIHTEQTEMSSVLKKVAVTQENVVLPRIQLLAEGHTTIQEQIRNLSVIDRLQDDVSTLKSAVRMLTQEIEELKAAM